MQGNQLTTLPTRLNLRRLKQLHLGNNQLSSIEPCTFCAAPHLATLGLEGNQLVQGLAAAFPPLLPSLVNLQLGGNLLEQEELEELLNRFPNLATLSLAATGLVSFPAELIVNNKQLTHLNIRCDFQRKPNLEKFTYCPKPPTSIQRPDTWRL